MDDRVIRQTMLEEFRSYLIEGEKSPATVEKYLRDVQHFFCHMNGRPVTKQAVLEYKVYLGETYAVASANSMLASVNVLLRHLGWHDLCVKQLKHQRQAFAPEQKEITRAEYQRLVATAYVQGNNRLGLILQTICATGIRVSELPFITVEAAKRGEAVVHCKGKTRTVLLVKELRTKLLRYAKERGVRTGALFVTRSGRPISRTAVWREMKALCRGAKVAPSKVFPHNLRHLFARAFYDVKKDIAALADVLGHSSINTTRIYLTTTCTAHRKQLERMALLVPKCKKPATAGLLT